jgi:hypothetical protein
VESFREWVAPAGNLTLRSPRQLCDATMILLQVASQTAVAVLALLIQEPAARPIVQTTVDAVLAASGAAQDEWYRELGLGG